jgi:hypothetical protein
MKCVGLDFECLLASLPRTKPTAFFLQRQFDLSMINSVCEPLSEWQEDLS